MLLLQAISGAVAGATQGAGRIVWVEFFVMACLLGCLAAFVSLLVSDD